MKEKTELAVSRAKELLEQHKLVGWTVGSNNKRKNIAETWHAEKKIVFSRYFIAVASREEFDGVALHEIAHALLGPGFGHGEEFVSMCKKISPNDDYARPKSSINIARYRLTCPECGQSAPHNSSRDNYCGICFMQEKEVVFSREKNVIKIVHW